MEPQSTKGEQLAESIRPFISMGVENGYMDETIANIAKSIDRAINDACSDREHNVLPNVIHRVKQTLSALDYNKLTDFQAKCVLLLEQYIK